MKNFPVLLALSALATLPACTINNYGTVSDGNHSGRHRSVYGQYTDTVYVSGSSTTVVSQSGVVGAPGPGRYPGPRPPRSPRPPIAGPGRGPATASPGTMQPATVQPGGVQPGTMQPATVQPGTVAVQPVVAPGTPGPGKAPVGPARLPIRTGGTKPPHAEPGQPPVVTGGIKAPYTEPDVPAQPAIVTGGIKAPYTEPVQPGATGGIKAPYSDPDAPGQPPIVTGGIKAPYSEPSGPVRAGGTKGNVVASDGNQAADNEPVTLATPVTEPVLGPTGGIKPSRGLEMPAAEAGPVLEFRLPGCRGTCPTYTATVWASGRVSYVGGPNVPLLGGPHELRLPAATVAAMQQQAREVGFATLPESYANGDTDQPARVLTLFDAQGIAKSVTMEGEAPEPVRALFDYVDGQVSQLAAKGSERSVPQSRRSR